MASNAKPIECFRCPCKDIIGDPNVYCVTENFYSGGNCTGSVVQTLPHKCMCMDDGCQGTWDKATFCQDRVQYVYESGPHGISCPSNCVPAVCPSNCTSCGTVHLSVSGTVCSYLNGATFTLTKSGGAASCIWQGYDSMFNFIGSLRCLSLQWFLQIVDMNDICPEPPGPTYNWYWAATPCPVAGTHVNATGTVVLT